MRHRIVRHRLGRWVDPASVFEALHRDSPQAFWLDSGIEAFDGVSYIGASATWVTASVADSTVTEHPSALSVPGTIFDFLRGRIRVAPGSDGLPLGWVGWFGYELRAQTMAAPEGTAVAVRRSRHPDAALLDVDRIIAFDHARGTVELIAIAEREYAFSLGEIKKAAREMGFGDDWKAAMERVKDSYVEPGKQPEMIRNLARQAEDFFAQHDWVTIPPLAREDWRMEMMSPERQRLNPFFLGGELIQVSYPTDEMTHEEKLMSMRGNNPHFSHATVFHELNPGHHLQGFMAARHFPHRALFATPFWSEGNALYWEMFLYDHDFHVTPDDRIGALFWRMHRSARIIFSLNFHLGRMSPDQAVQFLVDTVNFERANAEGEVRRSFAGNYSPLYQAAYMLGGLQMRAMYKALVGGGQMTEREFHDGVLLGGSMPMAMVRARLAAIPLTRDGPAPWKFADELPAPRPFPVRR